MAGHVSGRRSAAVPYVTTVASRSSRALAGNDSIFVEMRELAAAEAQALIADARVAPAAASCTDVATKLVVVSRVSRERGRTALHRRTRRMPTGGGPGFPGAHRVRGTCRAPDACGLRHDPSQSAPALM